MEKNLSADAADMGSIPGWRKFHVLLDSEAGPPQATEPTF